MTIPGGPSSQRGPSDEELRELFSVLRSEDEAHVPAFMAERGRRRNGPPLPSGWRLATASVFAATVLAGTVFAALLWLRQGPPRTPGVPGRGPVPVISITEWKPPTDFLLNTPGREILRTAPVIRLQPYLNSTGAQANRKPKTLSTRRSPGSRRSPTPLPQ